MRSSIKIEIVKKNQTEILELKNTMHEIKIQKIASISDMNKQEEEKIWEFKDRGAEWIKNKIQ